jgi:hypothetical protein
LERERPFLGQALVGKIDNDVERCGREKVMISLPRRRRGKH